VIGCEVVVVGAVVIVVMMVVVSVVVVVGGVQGSKVLGVAAADGCDRLDRRLAAGLASLFLENSVGKLGRELARGGGIAAGVGMLWLQRRRLLRLLFWWRFFIGGRSCGRIRRSTGRRGGG
jgi:hypothetical protein